MQTERKQTSLEWYNDLYPEGELIIVHPNGWDRSNWQYSFYTEVITEDEFKIRLMNSYCLMNSIK